MTEPAASPTPRALRKHVTLSKDGDPRLLIRAQGAEVIFLLADALMSGSPAIADLGRRTLRSLREVIGRDVYAELDASFVAPPDRPHVWMLYRKGHVAHAVPADEFSTIRGVPSACGGYNIPRQRLDAGVPGRRYCATCLATMEENR